MVRQSIIILAFLNKLLDQSVPLVTIRSIVSLLTEQLWFEPTIPCPISGCATKLAMPEILIVIFDLRQLLGSSKYFVSHTLLEGYSDGSRYVCNGSVKSHKNKHSISTQNEPLLGIFLEWVSNQIKSKYLKLKYVVYKLENIVCQLTLQRLNRPKLDLTSIFHFK